MTVAGRLALPGFLPWKLRTWNLVSRKLYG